MSKNWLQLNVINYCGVSFSSRDCVMLIKSIETQFDSLELLLESAKTLMSFLNIFLAYYIQSTAIKLLVVFI